MHELGFQECAKSFIFRGSKEVSMASIADQLSVRQQVCAPLELIPNPLTRDSDAVIEKTPPRTG